MRSTTTPVLFFCLLFACSDSKPSGAGSDGSGSSSGASSNGDSGSGGAEDLGGGGSGGDGGFVVSDGGVVLDPDGGNPLEQDRAAFCAGQGGVVVVGSGGECAGEIAEETFQFGLCSCEQILVQSSLQVDAFDSELGAYAADLGDGEANVFTDGNLGSNAALLMEGKLTVDGSVYTGGGFSVGAESAISGILYADGTAEQQQSQSRIAQNVYVAGDVLGRYAIDGDLVVPSGATVESRTLDQLGGALVRDDVNSFDPCPCAEERLLDVAGLVEFGRTRNDNELIELDPNVYASESAGPARLELPCGRFFLNGISHQGSLSIVATGRTILFVAGDAIIDGSFDLAVEPGAEVDVFISGRLAISASARLGDADSPAAVRTYVGGAEDIVLTASSVFGGNLYAPRARVEFGASADLFGALFARQADFSGSAAVHFDRAIQSSGEECAPPPMEPVDGGLDMGVADGGPTMSEDMGGSGQGDPGGAGSPCADVCVDCQQGLGCGEGTCGACASDLDCCAPNRCIAGECMVSSL